MIKFGAYKCKTCRDKYHAEWRKKNKDKWNAYSLAYSNSDRERVREIKRQSEAKKTRDEIAAGKRRTYQVRKIEGRLKNYKLDPMIRREVKNRYRARKLNTVSEKYRAKDVFEKYDYTCVYCGTEAKCLDHVVPLSKGGHDVIQNLVAACKPCNTSKGAKLLSEWRN